MMTIKELKSKFNIRKEDDGSISLYRKRGEYTTGIGYCGTICLKDGKAIFNDEKFSDIESLDNALRAWEESLEFPIDTYDPLYNEEYRTESRLVWYLTEKLGFELSRKDNFDYNSGTLYIRPLGDKRIEIRVRREFNRTKDITEVYIHSRIGDFLFSQPVTDEKDGIKTINTIVNNTILNMAKDMVDALSVCSTEVTNEIDTFVKTKENIFGIKKASFKDTMVARLEEVLEQLKNN